MKKHIDKILNEKNGVQKKKRLNEADGHMRLIHSLEKWKGISELFKSVNAKDIIDAIFAMKDAYIIGVSDKIDFQRRYSNGKKPKSIQDIEDGKWDKSIEALYAFLKACHAFYNTNGKDLANYEQVMQELLDDAYEQHDRYADSLGINWDMKQKQRRQYRRV